MPATVHPTPRMRLATASDVDAMITVVNAAFAIETFLDGTRTDLERMTDMMRKGEFLVAEDDSAVTGCVYLEKRSEHGYFGMLAVDPARQGEGIGRALVEAAETRCRQRGCSVMDISVLNLRPELLPFYQRLGYVQTGTEEFHPSRLFKERVECYCMILSKKL